MPRGSGSGGEGDQESAPGLPFPDVRLPSLETGARFAWGEARMPARGRCSDGATWPLWGRTRESPHRKPGFHPEAREFLWLSRQFSSSPIFYGNWEAKFREIFREVLLLRFSCFPVFLIGSSLLRMLRNLILDWSGTLADDVLHHEDAA